jgi:NAD(P)-dependent dehydrogenase (short-subunit alcohol dehydrogenase family)|tara:strand:+ start:641 stop:1375 length:735 start_codon:yes stop_codon:yes gene_type:complete
MSEFFNQVVIVTGGFQGNGLAIVNNFLKNGAKVYSLDNKYKKKREIIKKLTKIKVEINNYKKLKNIINQIGKKEKAINFLINNAGISLKFNQNDVINYWNKTLDVNLKAPYLLSYLCLPFLKKKANSSIINITSLNGKIAMSNNPAYNASKGGLSALTSCLAFDFSKFGIRVNGVSPGYIKTDMTKKSFKDKKAFKKRIDRMMLKNYGTTQDIADAVLYLASQKSKFVNATEIVVDGGLLKKGI